MASKGRRICIKVFELGCSVPTIEVPCKPEHGEFGTPLAKRPIKAINELLTQFLNRTVQEAYFDQVDIVKFFGGYIATTDFEKLKRQKNEGITSKHLYMNELEKPIMAVKKQIMEG
jgi:hypothetical protein